MSKLFVLRAPEHAHSLIAFLKANAGPQAASGKPLAVSVDEYAAKRSTSANARYWALLEDIAEQAVVDGKRFSREVWHEWFKDRYAPKQEGPSGLMAMSTGQMSKEDFARYTTQIEVYAVQTLGVEFATV